MDSSDRNFFQKIARAGAINPFSDEHKELEVEISGVSQSASRGKRTQKIVYELQKRIERLEEKEQARVDAFEGEDRDLMQRVFLYELFYKFKDQFDELIQSQIEAGDTPVKIPFYNDVHAAMEERGFSEEEFRQYFALAYQIRRAFYFIDRGLIGTSPTMKNLRLNLWKNIFTHNLELYDRYLRNRMEDFSTLLLGETGTGKGTAALAIGRSGFIPLNKRGKSFTESFSRSFVSLNLSQFPETLIESALFGHKKGAFTGAVEDYQGVFETCSQHGAILLDEIGEVSEPIQIKLLQVLQERVFTPVGSQKQSRFKGRVIAATNRPLEDIRDRKIFRDDFYYRLCSDIITVPPLRWRLQENPKELDMLLKFTVKRLVGKHSQELVDLVKNAVDLELGADYPWPGNVRELEQFVRRILLKGTYSTEPAFESGELDRQLVTGIKRGNIDAASLISGYCCLLYQRHHNFEEVARRTGLDRRTVKKYIQDWDTPADEESNS
ncbi:MAG: sigma 54-interacting transcriptional regulator [Desulfobacteraceae bacterium]|nr:sigma 54-interacting transcriptional regulator [Desulfobacteraceae bacterium]MCF8095197.1 sigma 54-interacting transcriptional regulator [Desulfobacteraceae bacterium]